MEMSGQIYFTLNKTFRIVGRVRIISTSTIIIWLFIGATEVFIPDLYSWSYYQACLFPSY